MNRRDAMLGGLASAAVSLSGAGELLTMEDFVEAWRISKDFTLAVAERMPEEHYGFKPNPEQMSYGEQMLHIAGSLFYRFAQLAGEKPPVAWPLKKTDKPAVLRVVAEAYDYTLAKLKTLKPGDWDRTFDVDWKGRPRATGRQMALNMFVHAAHHRAQCEVYLRIKGIKPPDYTF